ncbi:hypothetical protein ACHAXA_007349 [Cyclostephanos tholiformis]|uniref:Uncharacterized protein n=1 Tax=Cyclostephanos tholiformis TaxID=382380 RepID=A0ABD3RW17_9STRA
MILLTFESNKLTPFASAFACNSAMRSKTSCILSAMLSSAPLDIFSNSISARLNSDMIPASSSNTDMNSSRNVRDMSISSTNSCRNIATLRSEWLLTTSPAVGSNSPASMRSWVVFPAPLAPTSPTRSPVCTPHVADLSTA